jgi:hypothetical protein
MGSDRTKGFVLAALVVVLAGMAYRTWTSSIGSALPSSMSGDGASPLTPQEIVEPPDVRLENLGAERPEPGGADRNLFRFGTRTAPRASTAATRPAPPSPSNPPATRPAGSAAPIALKFIGIVEAPNRSLRLAILSDGRGVYHGREGDIIEGRYRIVTIGVESIEMSRLDGGGSQTIRLSGS